MGIATAILPLSPPIFAFAAAAKRASRLSLTLSHCRIRFIKMSATTPESEAAAAAAPEELGGATGGESKEKDEVVVQYVVLRRDLIDEWPTGSVVSQGCHASVAAIWQYKDDPHTIHYCSPSNLPSMHKVTLEVKGETQMVSLSEKLKAGGISHYLWIEQPENFPTCLATKPYPKSMVSPFFKKLKLCK